MKARNKDQGGAVNPPHGRSLHPLPALVARKGRAGPALWFACMARLPDVFNQFWRQVGAVSGNRMPGS